MSALFHSYLCGRNAAEWLIQMTEARVGYHKEVKTASFQGKSITVENLTPMLSPKARDKRKREIESCLYEVFVKYAPGRAQMH